MEFEDAGKLFNELPDIKLCRLQQHPELDRDGHINMNRHYLELFNRFIEYLERKPSELPPLLRLSRKRKSEAQAIANFFLDGFPLNKRQTSRFFQAFGIHEWRLDNFDLSLLVDIEDNKDPDFFSLAYQTGINKIVIARALFEPKKNTTNTMTWIFLGDKGPFLKDSCS